jgi:hypothetical protein
VVARIESRDTSILASARTRGCKPQSVDCERTAPERQNDYSRISSSISQLPSLDISEKGRLDAKLSMIRDLVRDMKNINQDDTPNIKRILDDISTQYSDVESILSELVERILKSLEPSRS